MALITRHILISGKVQGVGFRNYALTSALVAGLLGWVRNLKDGRVEALVRGEKDAIETFLQQLKKGPPLCQVANVEVRDVDGVQTFRRFLVERDGEQPWRE